MYKVKNSAAQVRLELILLVQEIGVDDTGCTNTWGVCIRSELLKSCQLPMSCKDDVNRMLGVRVLYASEKTKYYITVSYNSTNNLLS